MAQHFFKTFSFLGFCSSLRAIAMLQLNNLMETGVESFFMHHADYIARYCECQEDISFGYT